MGGPDYTYMGYSGYTVCPAIGGFMGKVVKDAKCAKCVHVTRDRRMGMWQCGSEAVEGWDLEAARSTGACGPKAVLFKPVEFY